MDEDSGVSSSVQELIQLAKKDLEKNKEERKIIDKTIYYIHITVGWGSFW